MGFLNWTFLNGNECELGFEIAVFYDKKGVFIGAFGRECWFGDLGRLSDGAHLELGFLNLISCTGRSCVSI